MDKKNALAKNTIILAMGKVCTQLISFFLLPLYTALLSPQEYGAVDLFNTYCTLLLPIFNWQFDNGLFRFLLDCREDDTRKKNLFTTVMNANILQTVLYLLFFAVANSFITSDYKMYLAADVVFNIFLCSLLQFARGIGDTKTYTVASFISASSMVMINVVLIAILRLGADGMYIATVAAKLIAIVYLVFSLGIGRYYKPHFFDRGTFKELLCYSAPLIPNQLSWWVVSVSDRTIIKYALDIAANGIYSVANKYSGLMITVYHFFNLSWTESVSLHLKDSDREEFLGDIINSAFTFFVCASLGLVSLMPFVFPIMVNRQYGEAYEQIPILIAAGVFQVLCGLYSVIYVALKKSGEVAKTSFYSAVINIAANLLLIRSFGLYAASVSTFLAYFTMGVYRYFHVKRYINVPLKKGNAVGMTAVSAVVLLSYYLGNFPVQAANLAIVCIYSVFMNRSFLRFMWEAVKRKMRRENSG